MRDAIINFVGLNPQNIIEPLYWMLAAGWLVFVCTTIFSILSRRIRGIYKVLWIVLVIFAPGAGILLYLLYSLFAADYSFLERFGLGLPSTRPKA